MCPHWFLTGPSLGKAKQACEEESECSTRLLSQLRKTQRNVFFLSNLLHWLPWWPSDKESSYQCRRHGLDSWVRKILWRRKWLLTPVFLAGEFHGQRSLVGYSPWGCRELGTTYQLNNNKITAPIRTTAVCSPAEAPVGVGAGGCLSQVGVSLLASPSQPTDTSSLSPLGSEED